jgi:hypothetical protein
MFAPSCAPADSCPMPTHTAGGYARENPRLPSPPSTLASLRPSAASRALPAAIVRFPELPRVCAPATPLSLRARSVQALCRTSRDIPMMAFKALFLSLWTQTAFAQSCSQSATFSLEASPYKTRTYAALSSSNCSSGTGPFDFTVVNPSSHQFAYYAAQYIQCYNYYSLGMYSYDKTYSNPNGTNATFVSVAQVPCILYPCCVILQCQSSLGCPNLTLNTLWSNVQRTPYSFPYSYVYYPLSGLGGLGTALFLLSRKCKKEDADPSLAEPIMPAAATEETPLKIRKPRKETEDGHV